MPRISKEVIDQIISLYFNDNPLSQDEIACRLGIKRNTVRYYINKHKTNESNASPLKDQPAQSEPREPLTEQLQRTNFRSKIIIDKVGLRKFSLTLTNSQKQFVKFVLDWIKNPQKMVLVVSGGPGTGKSHVVKNTLDFITTKQLRMSYTRRNAAAIDGKTIYSALHMPWPILDSIETDLKYYNLLGGQDMISRSRKMMSLISYGSYPTIVFVDEVSMINEYLMYWIIRFFMDRTESPILFVCVGDSNQLKPLRSNYNLFSLGTRLIKYELRKIHLSENTNSFAPEYEKLLNELCKFVKKRNNLGMIDFVSEHFPVVNVINDHLLSQANRAMAFTNGTVNHYNEFYLKNMIPGNNKLITIPKNIVLKEDCLVFVTKDGFSEARNGSLLIFQRFDFENDIAICKNPKTQLEVQVNKSMDTMPLTLGFATTIHKYESNLIEDEKIVINFDESDDLNLVYTALSRVKSMEQIIAIQW